MTKEQENLFLLMKSALWNDELSTRSIRDVDWGELYKLANEQCLVGIVADTFRYLSIEQCNRDERLRWLAYVVRLEKKNQEMNLLVGKLFGKFCKMNLSPVLLKGQAFAANYTDPQHRQCGDIDVYFKNRKDCETAVAWAAKIDKSAAVSPENKRERKHFTFSIGSNVVELHYLMCLFENSWLHQRLQQIIDEEFDNSKPYFVEIEGEQIETVPPTLSALHQIIHISRHLLEAGIGLRQICDLAMFLDKHHEVIDKERLNGYLEELQLMTIARSLGYIMVKYLGLKEEKVPFEVDAQFADFILQEIFEGGNFGKKKVEYREKSKGLRRKLQSVYYFYMRCKLYKPLMPKEARSYFWKKISLNFRLMTKHHY